MRTAHFDRACTYTRKTDCKSERAMCLRFSTNKI